MRTILKGLGFQPLVFLLSATTAALAAGPDLRLITAAKDQNKAAVRTLLKEGVDINVAAADGSTPLHWAAHWDDLETVDLLLKARANVNAANDHGVTPLDLASENGRRPTGILTSQERMLRTWWRSWVTLRNTT